jgi:hypothetical protein
MYLALQIARTPTGQHFTDIDRRTGEAVKREWYAVSWIALGQVKDMAEAKARFGGSPVLQESLR